VFFVRSLNGYVKVKPEQWIGTKLAIFIHNLTRSLSEGLVWGHFGFNMLVFDSVGSTAELTQRLIVSLLMGRGSLGGSLYI